MARNPFGRGFSGLIDLPLVSGDTTVSDALELMTVAKRAAVIVSQDHFHYLHTATAVVGALRKIYPTDSLANILLATGAPYLPLIDNIPRKQWPELMPNLDVLRQRGVIGAIPEQAIRIGGLITQTGDSVGVLLALRGMPVRNLTGLVTKCVCKEGHRLLPEELVNNLCPMDQTEVACG